MESRPEPRIVTMADVARAAGVSTSTVSRVLTGSHRVRESRERQVREAATRLGYRMNAAAQGLRRRRTLTLGIVCRQLESPMLIRILSGLASRTQEEGYSLLVTNAQGDERLYETLVQRLFEARVDGLFLGGPVGLRGSELAFTKAGIPVLALFAGDQSASHLPLVTADEVDAIQQAVTRLVDLGHRHFGQLLTRFEVEFSDRYTAVDKALKEMNRTINHTLGVVDSGDDGSSQRAVRELLSREPRPTVVFASDPFLSSLLAEAASMCLQVPGDLSVVAYEHATATRMPAPSISTISVDAGDIGRVAANVMIDWLSGKEPAAVTNAMPAHWIEGGSIAAVVGDEVTV